MLKVFLSKDPLVVHKKSVYGRHFALHIAANGPALNLSSFPQEAYFEITILAIYNVFINKVDSCLDKTTKNTEWSICFCRV